MRFCRIALIFIFGLAFSASSLSAEEDAVLSELRIDGIAYDSKAPENSIAMINAIALHTGDEFHGFKVAEIAPGHVMMVSIASGIPYELTPGDGAAHVEKREAWDPLKSLNLSLPKIPAGKKPHPAGANTITAAQKANRAALDANLKKLNPFATLYESKARVEKQIDDIKAVQKERSTLLNGIMDDMEPKPKEKT